MPCVRFARPEAPVDGEDKVRALRAIVDHITPGRWDEARPPSDSELRLTTVLRMPIDEASAKVRAAGPVDEAEDLELPVWAGQVPVSPYFAAPVDADDLTAGLTVSPAVARLRNGGGSQPAA